MQGFFLQKIVKILVLSLVAATVLVGVRLYTSNPCNNLNWRERVGDEPYLASVWIDGDRVSWTDVREMNPLPEAAEAYYRGECSPPWWMTMNISYGSRQFTMFVLGLILAVVAHLAFPPKEKKKR